MTTPAPLAPDILASVDELYSLAAGRDGWRACLEAYCEATGSVGAIFRSLTNPSPALVSPALLTRQYPFRRRLWTFDMVAARVRRRRVAAGLLTDADIDPATDGTSHLFFEDFVPTHDLGAFTAYVSPAIYDGVSILVAYRARSAGPFGAKQIAMMRDLAPHISRALAIATQLTVARSRDDALLAILDKLTYGAMLVGRSGKVLAMNDVAQTLLDDGVSLVDGMIHETFSNPRGTVERIIKLAFADEPGVAKNALIHRPSGRRPIVLQAAPFPHSAATGFGHQGGDTILLMLIDTGMAGVPNQMSVLQSFGLTLAEAKVATLVGSGLSPVDAAEQLGSAAGTVRVQLKNVFNKLDIKRQSELVRLMAKLEVLGS